MNIYTLLRMNIVIYVHALLLVIRMSIFQQKWLFLYVLASLGCTSKSVVTFHHYDAIHESIAQLVEPSLLRGFCWFSSSSKAIFSRLTWGQGCFLAKAGLPVLSLQNNCFHYQPCYKNLASPHNYHLRTIVLTVTACSFALNPGIGAFILPFILLYSYCQ